MDVHRHEETTSEVETRESDRPSAHALVEKCSTIIAATFGIDMEGWESRVDYFGEVAQVLLYADDQASLGFVFYDVCFEDGSLSGYTLEVGDVPLKAPLAPGGIN